MPVSVVAGVTLMSPWSTSRHVAPPLQPSAGIIQSLRSDYRLYAFLQMLYKFSGEATRWPVIPIPILAGGAKRPPVGFHARFTVKTDGQRRGLMKTFHNFYPPPPPRYISLKQWHSATNACPSLHLVNSLERVLTAGSRW